MQYSVIAADTQQLYLKGMADYLAKLSVVECVNTCSTYNELLQALRQETPDILFLDLNLVPAAGFEICAQLKQHYPQLMVVIISHYDSEKYAKKARNSGADAYIIKSTDPEIISNYLLNMASGSIKGFYARVTQPVSTGSIFDLDKFELKELLTCRERQVLGMMLNGLSHKEIGTTLRISYSTFKTHRTNIMQKLKIRSAIELGILASSQHLFDL